MSDNDISRRRFVSDVSLAGAGVYTAGFVPHGVTSMSPGQSRDKLNVACIGIGGMGFNDVRGMSSENIVALCDVDDRAAERAYAMWPTAKRYKDYRELISRESGNFDVVTISTPDHHHAAAAMLALKAGKHVYCQKPLARTVGEVRALKAEAARRPNQITQMGNQGHSQEGTRVIREWVEAGVIGTVQRVEFWTNRPIWGQGINRPTEMHNVPATLDWDLWLGPAPQRPYHPAFAPFAWRGWWDFGTGAMGDMACHIMDAAFWTLDLGYPARVIPESSQLYPETAPKMSRITYEFPARGSRPAITVVWRDGSFFPARPPEWGSQRPWPMDQEGGQLWIGDKGSFVAGTYGGDPTMCDPTRHAELIANPVPQKYPRTEGVYKEFITAIKERKPAGSPIAGHASALTEMIVLGNLAVRSGRTIELNPSTGALVTTGIPAEWVTPTYRTGWSL